MSAFDVDTTIARREIHRLLCLVLTQLQIGGFGKKYPRFCELSQEYSQHDIIHLIGTTAIMNRMRWSRMRASKEGPAKPSQTAVDDICGVARYTSGDPEEIALDLFAASNKIVHADHKEIADNEWTKILMSGELGGREWFAELDLLDYIDASIKNFS